MKEEICETILNINESWKWEGILHAELETKGKLFSHSAAPTFNVMEHEIMFSAPFHHAMFVINHKIKEIIVYDDRIYNFCKEFGEKYEFNKLVKF